MTGRTKRDPKWDWEARLTKGEAETVWRADETKRAWQRLQAERAVIQNRAIQRAKYASRTLIQEAHNEQR